MAGVALWKFKTLSHLVLAKAKLFLSGFTDFSTLSSMLLSFGVYWSIWGWKFALGLVLSIYVHEMGHVVALRRYGIRATGPMFIPGVGAVVRMKRYPANPRQDARVGLAGPVWGLGAAMVACALYLLTNSFFWAVIASVGAWLNLFNLLPVWQLDGARGFRALSKPQRWWVVGILSSMFLVTGEGLLLALVLPALWKVLEREMPAEPDRVAFTQYAILVVAFSMLCGLQPLIPCELLGPKS